MSEISTQEPTDSQRASSTHSLEKVLETYGDAIFEVGNALLWSQAGAIEVVRRVARKIRVEHSKENWGSLERAWILQAAVDASRVLEPKIGRRLSPPERMMLDALETPEHRIQQIESFFHRLEFDRQALLLLRDKLELPFSEIARILRTPVDSLKVARQQAYRLLEEWIWGDSAPSRPETFRYLTYLSDLLDGDIDPSLENELKKLAQKDPECALRLEHAQTLRDSIRKTRKRPLPETLRESLSRGRLKSVIQDLPRPRSLWQRTPLFLRTSLEGLGIGILILAVVAITPRIRLLYERSVERRLEAISLGDLVIPNDDEDAGAADAAPLARGKTLANSGTSDIEDDFEGEDESEPAPTKKGAKDEKLRVGSSEIWRFNIKTDSPRELRQRVIQILTDLRLPADTPGLGGIEAPGGIQFDLMVPTWGISSLKSQLQRLAAPNQRSVLAHRPSHSAVDNSSISDLFTWYRSKSRRRVPPGKARVVIWLSQT